MEKKQLLSVVKPLIAAALLFGSSGGVAWGQHDFRTDHDYYINGNITENGEHGDVIIRSTFSVENNYGPGETGTLTPRGGGNATNMGYWSSPQTSQGFNAGNGIVTIGGTNNVVLHRWVGASSRDYSGSVYASITPSTSYTCDRSVSGGQWQNPNSSTWWNGSVYHAGYAWTTKAQVVAPVVPDGTGVLHNTNNYTCATVVTISAGQTYVLPWVLQTFNYKDNPWYYHKVELQPWGTYTHTVSVSATANSCGFSPSYYNANATDSRTHSGIEWKVTADQLGGHVPGWLVLIAGSHVNLTQGISSSATQNAANLLLPGDNTNYSLMIDGTFDNQNLIADLSGTGSAPDGRVAGSASTALTANDQLAKNAVFGIHGGFSNGTIKTNPGGGTLLLGPGTTGQQLITVQSSTTAATGTVTQYFTPVNEKVKTPAYGNTYYQHNVVSVGNYGTDGLGLDQPSMLNSTTTGPSSGLQLFSHTPDPDCTNLIFKDATNTPWTFTIAGGNLLIDAKNNLDFGTTALVNTNTFTTSGDGHTTLRGGNHVAFINGVHTYNGSKAGNYWVEATSHTPRHTPNSPNYCGVGDILTYDAAPVIVKNVGGNGDLKWEAERNIDTDGTVSFSADGQTNTDWISHTGNIITDRSNNDNGAVKFKNDGTGYVKWTARGIGATPLGPSATTGNISTYGGISFSNTSTGNTDWFARNNITTNDTVLFDNTGTGNTKWHAETGNITTNRGTTGPGFVTFTNSGATGANTDWWAGQNILTNNYVTFTNTTAADGYIKWWAQNNNIETNDSTVINQNGTAVNSSLRGSAVNANPGAGALWFLAKNNILTENAVPPIGSTSTRAENPLSINFGATNNAPIMLHAMNGSVITDGVLHINRLNTTASETTIEAGRDIHFLDTVTLNDASIADILLHAHRDIRVNDSTCNAETNAPVRFTVTENTTGARTRWIADRNMILSDTVDFQYGSTSNKVKDIHLVAQGGNIQSDRWLNIDYDGENQILFSAVDDLLPYNYTSTATGGLTASRVHNSGTETWRHLINGNILFNDSTKITRTNMQDGETNILAKYNIRTYTFDYQDKQSTGNKTRIESYKGDIYLGYSTKKDGCQQPAQTDFYHDDYDKSIFRYTVSDANVDGQLDILAGFKDATNNGREGGGNIYVTHMVNTMKAGGKHPTNIKIPYSNEYICGNNDWSPGDLYNRKGQSMISYEHSGIIFGVGHCGNDAAWATYAPMLGPNGTAHDTSLIYYGNRGDLTVDAGTRGNIIINRGAYLNFQDPGSTGNAIFRTRFGDIDMRNPFNVDSMVGSLLFLAQIENINDLSKVKFCSCEEERNNVYLQDFQYRARAASGSVFVGADNNIKLNYGGLQNIGTRHDPFLSKDYTPCPDGGQQKIGYGYNGSTCSDDLHCDADSNVNKARTFLMKFDKDTAGNAITSGGFGAVASDYIDVYRKFEYYGGNGSGMSSVPGTGTLHGENVAGYGLFMKTQANKGNWDYNIFEKTPDCPTPCDGTSCSHDYLHMVSRMTFHDDAYIEAHNQKVMLWSPVVETFGLMTLNTEKDAGGNTEITLKADSLIFHDDFIKKGNRVKLSTWSGLHKDLPIMKFGHMRKTPPFIEAKKSDCQTYTECVPCYRYIRFSKDPLHMLDTITIKFGDGAYLERLNTVVFDHTVLTCLTDSFDHVKGGEVQNAQIFTDTFKIRHQVDLFADEKHERDAHLELISEEQMGSKDYAGIYTKHLHMEPIGACGTPYSELWTSDDLALDVITTSIFGGFGFIHSDVHVENGAHLNAGFTSLRLKGMCYEQMCGTQRMKDLRLDVGAQLHFSVGTTKGLNGEYSDAIEVDRLTTYGSVDVNIEIRPCEKMEKRCYPIIYYKSVTPNSLNQLKLNPRRVVIDGEEYPLHLNIGTDGVVYVCVGDEVPPPLTHTVTIPNVSGVTTDPGAGIWPTPARGNFKFKATFSGSKPLAVRTNRTVNGAPELLTGTKNANGEYEYIVPNVQQEITLSIGPDYVSNQLLAGTAVWSHGEMIYIRVDRADIASIYSVAGQLVRKVDLPEGDTSIPMSRGAYVITLKDGSVHKVIVK